MLSLVVIPAGNLLLPLSLLSSLSFPQGICFCFCLCLCFPWLSFPQGICFCFCLCLCFPRCHSRRESASAFAFAFLGCHSRRESASAIVFAFLVVIPAGNLLLPLPLLFSLSFPQGICFCCCFCFPRCHSRRESASAFAFAFLVVIPAGNLLLLLPLLFSLSFPQGICFCCCLCFSRCHSRRESAAQFPVGILSPRLIAHAELAVIATQESFRQYFRLQENKYTPPGMGNRSSSIPVRR